MKPITRCLTLLLFALLPSAVLAEAPLTVRGVSTIPTEKAKELFDKGALFVDVRSAKRFAEGHIASAVNLDVEGALNASSLAKLAEKDKEIVFYCDGVECGRSAVAAKLAVDWGYKSPFYYRGGWPAWQRAGFPTEP